MGLLGPPPLALMSRGLGELTVAACWWLVVVGADYVQRDQFFIIPTYVAVSYAVMVATVLLVCGVPDNKADRSVGKHTLSTRLSARGLAALYFALVLFAHAWVAVGVWALIPPAPTLWSFVALPPRVGGCLAVVAPRRQPPAAEAGHCADAGGGPCAWAGVGDWVGCQPLKHRPHLNRTGPLQIPRAGGTVVARPGKPPPEGGEAVGAAGGVAGRDQRGGNSGTAVSGRAT